MVVAVHLLAVGFNLLFEELVEGLGQLVLSLYDLGVVINVDFTSQAHHKLHKTESVHVLDLDVFDVEDRAKVELVQASLGYKIVVTKHIKHQSREVHHGYDRVLTLRNEEDEEVVEQLELLLYQAEQILEVDLVFGHPGQLPVFSIELDTLGVDILVQGGPVFEDTCVLFEVTVDYFGAPLHTKDGHILLSVWQQLIVHLVKLAYLEVELHSACSKIARKNPQLKRVLYVIELQVDQAWVLVLNPLE